MIIDWKYHHLDHFNEKCGPALVENQWLNVFEPAQEGTHLFVPEQISMIRRGCGMDTTNHTGPINTLHDSINI